MNIIHIIDLSPKHVRKQTFIYTSIDIVACLTKVGLYMGWDVERVFSLIEMSFLTGRPNGWVASLYLKQLEVENFKSFKGKLTIPFMDGFTAITGPNGSGKSNISDAVLFALGPRSSKAIRAGKLTDLIFNGGKAGKSAAFCKVSLIFDNSEKILPVDSPEVKLTRLVKRSKTQIGYTSYFYVNGKKSTMGDFDNILAHARITSDGYNIVQQGDITNIVSMGAVERRTILDEIAGITRFDKDIDSANVEKIETDDNLERIDIIMDEIRKQLKQLEGERTSAMKYKEVKEKLDLARAQIEYKKKSSLENEMTGLEEQINKREAEIEGTRKDKENLVKALGDLSGELDKLEKKFASKSSQENMELKNKIDGLRVEIARARDSVELSRESIPELKSEKKKRAEDIKKIAQELGSLNNDLKDTESKLKDHAKEIKALEKDLEKHKSKLSSSDSDLSKVQNEIVGMQEQADKASADLKKLIIEKDRATDKRDRLTESISKLQETRKELEFELKDTDWQLKEYNSDNKSSDKEMKILQDGFFKKKNLEEELSKQAVELENAIRSLTRQYNQLKAERDASKSVAKGYTAAVDRLMGARDKGEIKGIHGTVAELVRVDKKYETAINTAGGARMQALLVENDGVAEKCITYLKKNKIGRATFLPLNKMLSQRPRGKSQIAVKSSLGFALDLVDFDEQYRDAITHVFGDTIVVGSLKSARELMGGVRLVTTDGELIEASGAMIGGLRSKSMIKTAGVDKKDLDDVSKKLRTATNEADKISGELSTLRLELIDIEKKIKETGATTGSTFGKGEGFKIKKKGLQSRLKTLKDSITKSEKELAETEKAIKTMDSDLMVQADKAETLRSQKAEMEKTLFKMTPAKMGKEMNDLQSRLSDNINSRSELDASRSSTKAQIKLYLERQKEVQLVLDNLDSNISQNQDNIKSKGKEADKLEVELKAQLKVQESMGKEMIQARDERDRVYKKKMETEAEIEKMNHRMETREDFLRGLRIEMNTATDRLAEIEEAVKDIKLDDPSKIPSMESLKKTIRTSEITIETIGSVNMLALETYDEQKARHVELKEEVKRLRDQRKRLIKLVDELKEKKKTGLLKVFDGINEKFKDVYADLSDGGEAELLLENKDDPFAGGLQIKARPKGKKVHRLEALSGGEKGLVSMSFIFAIQRYQPSPFYVLDEVDQNLDAINAGNIARMIKRNSEKAQFLQISLREVTLKEASNLIGVTMQNDGISKVIMKVDLGKIKDVEADTLTTTTPENDDDEIGNKHGMGYDEV